MTPTLAFLLFVVGYSLFVYGILVPLANLTQSLTLKAIEWKVRRDK